MSTQALRLAVEPQQPKQRHITHSYFFRREDCSYPIAAKRACMQVDSKAFNLGTLLVRESLGQRTLIRLGTECFTTRKGKRTYARLRGTNVTLSCPSSQQAELAIEAILEFAMSLDGKWLAPAPQSSPEPSAK